MLVLLYAFYYPGELDLGEGATVRGRWQSIGSSLANIGGKGDVAASAAAVQASFLVEVCLASLLEGSLDGFLASLLGWATHGLEDMFNEMGGELAEQVGGDPLLLLAQVVIEFFIKKGGISKCRLP